MSFESNSNVFAACAAPQYDSSGLFVNPLLVAKDVNTFAQVAYSTLPQPAYSFDLTIQAPMMNRSYTSMDSNVTSDLEFVPQWGYMQNPYAWPLYHNNLPQGYIGEYEDQEDQPDQEYQETPAFEFNPHSVEFVPRPLTRAQALNPTALEFVPLSKVAELNPTAPEFVPPPPKKAFNFDPTVSEFVLHVATKLDPTTPEFVPRAPVARRPMPTVTEEMWDCVDFMDLLESCESFEELKAHRQPDEFISCLSPHALEFIPHSLAHPEEYQAAPMSKNDASLGNEEPYWWSQSPLVVHAPAQDRFIGSPVSEFEFSPFPRSSQFEYYDPDLLEPEWSIQSDGAGLVPQELTSVTPFKFGLWIQGIAVFGAVMLLAGVAGVLR